MEHMKDLIKEFKQFALKGSVVDLAVGIAVGGAFQKIVTSLVSDVIMPLVSPLLGVVNFSELRLGPVMIGNFLQATIDFIIIAFLIFLVVKGINSLRRSHKDEPQSMPKQEELLMEIRDILKQRASADTGTVIPKRPLA